MSERAKTKKQLWDELLEMRRRVVDLEAKESEYKQAQEVLQEREEKFRAIAETAVDAVILADGNGGIIFSNKGAQTMFGYSEEEILGKPLTVLMPERYREDHQKGIERLKMTGESKYIGGTSEMHGLRKDGSEFPIELAVSMWKARGETFYSGIVRNITRRRHLEHELKRLATTDRLTQAFNRTKFNEVINKEMERAKRYRHPLSMIMFDIDHFKEVNDTYGHAVGDFVLQTLTKIVGKNLRESDYLVRWGGEEFIIITPETDIEKTRVLAERVRRAIEIHNFDRSGQITVSFGVTAYRADDTEDTIVKRADDAMYEAKKKGRNRVVVSA